MPLRSCRDDGDVLECVTMKRLKAIFSAIRTLGRNPRNDIKAAWSRLSTAMAAAPDNDDMHIIEQIVFAAIDEAEAYMKKQGEQVETPAE